MSRIDQTFASCDQAGRIRFSRTPPQPGMGLIPICSGPDQTVRFAISQLAFKAKDGDRYYVPNALEGEGGPGTVQAIAAFTEAMARLFKNSGNGLSKEQITAFAKKLSQGKLMQ